MERSEKPQLHPNPSIPKQYTRLIIDRVPVDSYTPGLRFSELYMLSTPSVQNLSKKPPSSADYYSKTKIRSCNSHHFRKDLDRLNSVYKTKEKKIKQASKEIATSRGSLYTSLPMPASRENICDYEDDKDLSEIEVSFTDLVVRELCRHWV